MTACLSTFCLICCLFVPTKFHFSSSVLLCSSQLGSGQKVKMKAIFSTTARFKVAVFEESFCTNFGCFCSFFFPKIYLLLFLVASHVSLNPLPLISAIFAAYLSCLFKKLSYLPFHCSFKISVSFYIACFWLTKFTVMGFSRQSNFLFLITKKSIRRSKIITKYDFRAKKNIQKHNSLSCSCTLSENKIHNF